MTHANTSRAVKLRLATAIQNNLYRSSKQAVELTAMLLDTAPDIAERYAKFAKVLKDLSDACARFHTEIFYPEGIEKEVK
jgi:hypothetical protein